MTTKLLRSVNGAQADFADVVASEVGADAAGAAAAAQAASQPLDSDLTAFAGLAIAADKLPYGTGSHTLGLADFTAAGRAIVDDADATAQRTTLGLGTLATQSGTFSGTSSGTNTGDQTLPLDLWIGAVNPALLAQASAHTANRAYFNAFQVNRAVTVSTCKVQIVTQSGNIDVGIYTISGTSLTRIASSGSVACPATGVQTINLTASVALSPGVKYMAAVAVDNGTATMLCVSSGAGAIIQGSLSIAVYVSSSFPLPAGPTTFATTDVNSRTLGLYFA